MICPTMRQIVITTFLGLGCSMAAASVITVEGGQLKGQSLSYVDQFMGVPYAAPPTGPLRWRAPQPVVPWQGVRPARQPARACLQIGNFFASNDPETFDQPYGSEDCLYLNVWAPRGPTAERPVLVFFHGGSGIAGSSAHPIYDGARLARDLDAVVITANYRLGVWGSLQSDALHTGNPAEDSGSFFLLDMIRVLDWTSAHCPVLGCDGSQITISGQSAGAVAVLGLLRSPLAKGKFARAISFSGLPFSATDAEARKRTETLLKGLTDQEDARPALNELAPEALRDALYRQSPEALLAASGRGLSPLYVADGTVLMAAPDDATAHPGVVSKVPLMIGKTLDEMTTLIPLDPRTRSFGAIWPLVNGAPRDETLRQRIGWFSSIKRGMVVSLADWSIDRRIRKAEARYAEQLPAVFAYRFAWADYPDPWRSELGVFHGLDLPFIFGNFIDDQKAYMRFAWTEENRAEREHLHQEIAVRLRAFVHTGNPNPPDATGSGWPPWNQADDLHIWGR